MRETLTEKFYIKNVLNSDCRLQNLLPLKGNKNITGKLYHARLQTYKSKKKIFGTLLSRIALQNISCTYFTYQCMCITLY